MRALLLILAGALTLTAVGFVFVRFVPVGEVLQTNTHEVSAAAARVSLKGASITLPDRPDVSVTLDTISGESNGWSASYTNPVDSGDQIHVSIVSAAPVADLGSEGGKEWFSVPFSVRTAGTGVFVYLGLFSHSEDGPPAHFRGAVFVGDRVVVTALGSDESHAAVASYLMHADGEPMALPPTTPAFVRVLRAGETLTEVLRGVRAGTTEVTLSVPHSGDAVATPVHAEGIAPGGWFFEGQLPVRITDYSDILLGEGIAHAQGDWMTNGPVSFTADVVLSMPYEGPAILNILRDNPSGDPRNAASVSIPISIRNQ